MFRSFRTDWPRATTALYRLQPRQFDQRALLSRTSVNRLFTAPLSDEYQLLPESEKTGASEESLYKKQIEDVQTWWSSSRFQGVKRPYSAADVVSKRGTLQQRYPSSLMAKKLYALLRKRSEREEPVHTSLLFWALCTHGAKIWQWEPLILFR